MDGFSKTMVVAVAAVMVLAVAIPIIYVAEQDGSRQVTYHSQREVSTVEGDSVSDCHFERDGFVFIGWNTERDGSGTGYLPGDSLEGARGVWDLYAQWVRWHLHHLHRPHLQSHLPNKRRSAKQKHCHCLVH